MVVVGGIPQFARPSGPGDVPRQILYGTARLIQILAVVCLGPLEGKEYALMFSHPQTNKHDLVQSGKSSLTSWLDVKPIPQTNNTWKLVISSMPNTYMLFPASSG